jgi:hypothetical protein
MPHKKTPVIDRILRKITIENNGCWLWTGGTNNIGYGLIRDDHNGKKGMRAVHRIMAEHAGMNIEGTNVLHTCRDHLCVNPAHLFTGTLQEVYVAREADPKNPPFGRQKGVPQPRKQCPCCERMIPVNNMAVHIRYRHPLTK